jgi:hypothetical protein
LGAYRIPLETGLLIPFDKRGGINGSLQHLVKAFLYEPKKLILLASVNSNKTKALFRF